MDIKNQYLTIEQISETLNLGTRATMNLIRRGELPALKVGSAVRIRQDHFNEFLERSKMGKIKQKGENPHRAF
jgi:excisionase family DNA binding protein